MKKLLKSLVSALVIFGVIAGIAPANSATQALLNQPWQGIKMIENEQFLNGPPVIYAMTNIGKPEPIMKFCSSASDPNCVAAADIESLASLPTCDSQIAINCISSVYAISATGVRTEGIFQKKIVEKGSSDYAANPSINLPLGNGQGSIWKIAGVKGSGDTENYFVGTLLRSGMHKAAGEGFGTNKFEAFYMASAISPVIEKLGRFGPNKAQDSTSTPTGFGSGVGNTSQEPWEDCVVTDTGVCYFPKNFPTGYRFGMVIKISSKLTGWFHGRIAEPNISSTQSATGQTISIEAMPVQVPTLLDKVPTSDISSELSTLLNSGRYFGNGQGYYMPGASGPDAFDMGSPWIKMLKDKATTSNSYWSVRTLQGEGSDQVYRCAQNSSDVAGVVTTNSLVYSAGPPAFNKQDQTLDYKLLSPHYASDGSEAKGSYDLLLRSDVARCIYGFSKAPVSASISVLSADGTAQVSTTVLNEKNGWLTLSAKNFTFSSPIVRIKLTQEAEVVAPTPTPTPSASAKPVVKAVTITCIKGKTSKKVTAVTPKCPAGYKKK
jgi:hypothetical protein